MGATLSHTHFSCAFESHLGIGILRVPGGLDFSDPMNELQMKEASDLSLPEPNLANQRVPSFDIDDPEEGGLDSSGSFAGTMNKSAMPSRRGSFDVLGGGTGTPGTPLAKHPALKRIMALDSASIGTANGSVIGARLNEARPSLADIAQMTIDIRGPKDLAKSEKKQKKVENTPSCRGSIWSPQQREVLFSINRFRMQEKKAVIDVWWLFDDGGKTPSFRLLLIWDWQSFFFRTDPIHSSYAHYAQVVSGRSETARFHVGEQEECHRTRTQEVPYLYFLTSQRGIS